MTQEQVMKESRRLLFLLAAFFFVAWAFLIFAEGGANAALRPHAGGIALLGVICAVAGIAPFFWFRLGCIVVWLLGTVSTLMAAQSGTTVVALFIFTGLGLIYRMIKYRGVQEEPEVMVEENPLTPLRVSNDVSPKTLIFVVVFMIALYLLDSCYERLKADRSDELKKNQHSGQKRTK